MGGTARGKIKSRLLTGWKSCRVECAKVDSFEESPHLKGAQGKKAV
jgi:hypothetical protein